MIAFVVFTCILCVSFHYEIVAATHSSSNISTLPGPRFQWVQNDGYCGEVSTITAAMNFGSYLSQYDLREISARYKNNAQTKGEYLLGVNDEYTAKALRLDSTSWNSKTIDSKQFLVWVKQQFLSGNVVTIGVYTNEYLFYGDTNATAGDPEYDHIVTVYSIESDDPESNEYLSNDTITFSDHGLWNPHGIQSNASTAQYFFTYRFDDFQGSRSQANAKDGAVYTLPSASSTQNYAIAHRGLMEESSSQHVLIPIRVETSVNYESPEIGRHSNERPTAMSNVHLTVVVGPLDPGTYNLYRYDNEEKIPISEFNALRKNSVSNLQIIVPSSSPSNMFTFTETILSSDKIFYRCVSNSAP